MFNNRKLIIATKHEKEKVIAPIIEKELKVNCFVDYNFDTDTLGTFSGEIERKFDPITTAREKCLQAMKLNNYDLGIASEGSFGPHPSMYFVNADDEFLIFIDTKNNIEIIVRELSTKTNFNAQKITNKIDLDDFANQVGFPSHAIILRKSEGDNNDIIKGITDIETLNISFDYFKTTYNSVYAETDMRAMYNPTRMGVIEQATKKLVEKIKSECPECKMPGFAVTESKKGLECSLCGMPTQATLAHIYVCRHCNYLEEKMYPNGKKTEDPMYCNYCNP